LLEPEDLTNIDTIDLNQTQPEIEIIEDISALPKQKSRSQKKQDKGSLSDIDFGDTII